MNDLELWQDIDEADALDVLSDDDVLAVLDDTDNAVLEPDIIDVDYSFVLPDEDHTPAKRDEDKPAKRDTNALATIDEDHTSAIIETDFTPATTNTVTTGELVTRDDALDTEATQIQPTPQRDPLTALWRGIVGKSQPTPPTPATPSRRWHFIAEAPEALTDIECLRYWYFLFEFASLTQEWDEDAFVQWCESLDDESWAAYVALGRDVASGELATHLDDETAAAFASMKQASEASDDSPLGWLARWF